MKKLLNKLNHLTLVYSKKKIMLYNIIFFQILRIRIYTKKIIFCKGLTIYCKSYYYIYSYHLLIKVIK
uniref:Uncharacterized protein n=1 Tax=Caloglossa intermedia TaxID=100879 RepID=A0A1Z1M6J5_9FLOR|nr:hypothetical protein [Caloglossa intermedia]ARW61560.1 hypothetical protein [Caloglossa intermedia]